MVGHRSQKTSSQEQSSGWSTLLQSTVSRIALLMLLLGSWVHMLSIRSDNLLHKNFSTETWNKDSFPRRNYHINEFNIDDIINPYLQVNRHIDDGNKHNNNVTRYKVTSPNCNRPQVRHGLRIMMPSRRGRGSRKGRGENLTARKDIRFDQGKKKDTKPLYAEAEKIKEQQLEKILRQPRFDPMGDRKFSGSESSVGVSSGDASDSDFTDVSDTDDYHDKHSNNRRWETVHKNLGKVEEESSDDSMEHLTKSESNVKKKEVYQSPKRKEGSVSKRIQVHTPPVTHRHRDNQTPNTLDTPESLRIHHSFEKSKKRLDDTVRKYDEIMYNHLQAGNTVENPYDLPPKTLRFGGDDICKYVDHDNELNFDKLDSFTHMDEEETTISGLTCLPAAQVDEE